MIRQRQPPPSAMEARNRAFQFLKPPCVQLSQAALRLMGGTGSTSAVTNALQHVSTALSTVGTDPNILDAKLADYVFFPLSHVLKQLEKLPVRAKELTLECILALLQTAWKADMPPELGCQLLILLSFLADPGPGKPLTSSEELQALTFTCMDAVFTALSSSPKSRAALTASPNLPHLGKSVSVLLDGAVDGVSPAIQLAALSALHSFATAVLDPEALALSFLPGIMSALTKILTQAANARRSIRVLASALDVLTVLLPTVLSEAATANLPEKATATRLDRAWLRATSAQVNLALGNVVKLRQHDRDTVRSALSRLCLTIIQQCRASLSASIPMVLETLVTLAATDTDTQRALSDLLGADYTLAEILRELLRGWIVALPRVMQSTDDASRHRRIHQLELAHRLLSAQAVDLTPVDGVLAANLRDSVVNAIHLGKGAGGVVEYPDTGPGIMDVSTSDAVTFAPVLAPRPAQVATLDELSHFLTHLSAADTGLAVTRELIPSLPISAGEAQLASFWLSLTILRKSCESALAVTDMLALDAGSDDRADLLEQMYSFSLGVLTAPSDELEGLDWRLQALSLETLALQASQQGQAFRAELIDALYPVLHIMGAPHPALRAHAVSTLNILARSCGYASAAELVIGNVDYLVNAVGLRLNMFDLTPQAPRVLLMMVRLAGPGVVRYLGDVVESVFAALEAFHGYKGLVEGLFGALRGIVEVGVREPALAITEGGEGAQDQEGGSKQEGGPASMAVVAERFWAIRQRREEREARVENVGPFPQRPWKEEKEQDAMDTDDRDLNDINNDDDEATSPPPPTPDDVETPPPAPLTFDILLRIASLTQHYLPSSSAPLRTSLLSLLTTALPALAKHENTLLPAIHTLWPVVLARLDDGEAYVVAGAMDVVGLMCVHAGDFMRSRIEESWGFMKSCVLKRTRIGVPGAGASTTVTTSSGYTSTPTALLTASFTTLLTRIARYVPVSDMLFDDIVDLLAPTLSHNPDARAALEARNADAVWLAERQFAIYREKEKALLGSRLESGAGSGGAVVSSGYPQRKALGKQGLRFVGVV
ncbi:hypothetical protein EJ06DRAFT_397405 [Trichodelitschia bisporula]|uniref:ARM repeat-containing protein n=1 Tax=Trichodelitschia bisporula TaxID=703511 RepID=A0A6G1HXP5_9PEZI|nr:hypothetical protein EJ06DRAFT_397405 [Trichodelitschia bisporula]